MGETVESSRLMEDPGRQETSPLQTQSLSPLFSYSEHGQRQTRLLGYVCLAAVRTSHKNRACGLSSTQVRAFLFFSLFCKGKG